MYCCVHAGRIRAETLDQVMTTTTAAATATTPSTTSTACFAMDVRYSGVAWLHLGPINDMRLAGGG